MKNNWHLILTGMPPTAIYELSSNLTTIADEGRRVSNDQHREPLKDAEVEWAWASNLGNGKQWERQFKPRCSCVTFGKESSLKPEVVTLKQWLNIKLKLSEQTGSEDWVITYMNVIHYGSKAGALSLPLVDQCHGIVKVTDILCVHLKERGKALHDVSWKI